MNARWILIAALVAGLGCGDDAGGMKDDAAQTSTCQIGEPIDGTLFSLTEAIEGVLIDISGDGVVDEMDHVDDNLDGLPDDYNEDGFPDNRFYLSTEARCIPDADSFDDYEEPGKFPRGVTPVSSACEADGIETGPLILGFSDYRPSKYCLRRP